MARRQHVGSHSSISHSVDVREDKCEHLGRGACLSPCLPPADRHEYHLPKCGRVAYSIHSVCHLRTVNFGVGGCLRTCSSNSTAPRCTSLLTGPAAAMP